MKRLLHFLLLGCLWCCSSCDRSCISMEARIQLVGFPPSEIAQFQLKSFPKGSAFNSALDSVLFNASTCNCYRRSDTFEVSPMINNLPGLRSSYDYELVLPVTGRSYRITEVTENFLSQTEISTHKVACMNTLSSYKVNGAEQNAGARPVIILVR